MLSWIAAVSSSSGDCTRRRRREGRVEVLCSVSDLLPATVSEVRRRSKESTGGSMSIPPEV